MHNEDEKENLEEGGGQGNVNAREGTGRARFDHKLKILSKDGSTPPKYDSSLLKALHQTFFLQWWTAGILLLIGNMLQTTSPLVTKVFLAWLTDSYAYHAAGPTRTIDGAIIEEPKGIGYGIGLGFALFAMQQVASLCSNHYFISKFVCLYIRIWS